ncbi:hypothetical protein CYY_002616 [Polysphondylium violaceum]|uniref:F-box domain-containing protein n=1 Tax=Polysphondylium violaceum TaxID=133409 RepID=A0A8J4V6P9_9MYCE|nr:hypothetical protein CYY_002616 [Polysphondylium violaceum]
MNNSLNILDLPNDILEKIFINLNINDWYSFSQTCQEIKSIGNSNLIWRKYCKKEIEFNQTKYNELSLSSYKTFFFKYLVELHFTPNILIFNTSFHLKIKLPLNKPMEELLKIVKKNIGLCRHNSNHGLCDKHCKNLSWPKYILSNSKGMIYDRSKTPKEIGLNDNDTMILSSRLMVF